MRHLQKPVLFLFLFSIQFFCFGDENTGAGSPAIFFQPLFSYRIISFENITFHRPAGGFSVTRFNPVSKNLFSAVALYTADIIEGIQNDYPGMYHNIVLSLNGRTGRHSFLGAFTANTEKPLYGGVNTFNVFAGYTYNLINGPHFSMDLGGYLAFMDIGIKLPDGTPWFLWPLPFLSLKWDYEWLDVSFLPGITITIADRKPVSFTISKKTDDFDAALWYHYFRNENPQAEIFGAGIGLRNTTSELRTASGGIYGINYYALYGGIRLFGLAEISGGWVFNGKEKYSEVNWGNLFETYGHSDILDYNAGIGNGFFFSVSARFVF